MDIIVSEHTIFFSGYLDAIGRILTTNKELYNFNSLLVPTESSVERELKALIIESKEITDMIMAFE